MLNITRYVDEWVELRDRDSGRHLGSVKIVEVRGDRVRLGFEAPPDVWIYRRELEKPDEPFGGIKGGSAGGES